MPSYCLLIAGASINHFIYTCILFTGDIGHYRAARFLPGCQKYSAYKKSSANVGVGQRARQAAIPQNQG